jgi:sortase A
MKKHLSSIILFLVFAAGLSIFLYPSISNYVNSKHQSHAIASYDEALAKLSTTDYTKFWTAAKEYNRQLADRSTDFNLTDSEMKEYDSLLDPTGTGVMGHLEIESIGVDLPIYHGVTDSVLQVGIGHLPGSSLPTGGESTHCVLSGHRGLPSSKLLSDLDQMVVGDTFLIHIMDQTFAYQVDQINIVLPDETEGLAITKGMDYCTLVTCTPYGVNTHRLLVRGKRVDYKEESRLIVPADASKYSPLLIAPFLAIPILVILFIYVMMATSGHHPGKKE